MNTTFKTRNTAMFGNILLVFALLTLCQSQNMTVNIDQNVIYDEDYLGRGFGRSIARLGDFDGDGIYDLAIGTVDYSTPFVQGSAFVSICFMRGNGTIRDSTKIFPTDVATNELYFGYKLAAIGDVDGDGIIDIAVSSRAYSLPTGSVWIIFLHPNATVKGYTQIGSLVGGFNMTIPSNAIFGSSLCALGDFNEDGIPDLVVGMEGHQSYVGAVWIIFLESSGEVKEKILLQNPDHFPMGRFGSAVSVSDFDQDGITDLLVGSYGTGTSSGSAWIVFLNQNASINRTYQVSSSLALSAYSYFGSSVSVPGDIDNDGVDDIVVGSYGDENSAGAIYVMLMNLNGTVRETTKVSKTQGLENLTTNNYCGFSISAYANFPYGIGLAVGCPTNGNLGYVLNLIIESDNCLEENCEGENCFCLECDKECQLSYEGVVTLSNDITFENRGRVEFEDLTVSESRFELKQTALYAEYFALENSELVLDPQSPVFVEKTLSLSSSSLIINLQEETEELNLITISGTIEGEFDEITILLSGEETTLYQAEMENSTFSLKPTQIEDIEETIPPPSSTAAIIIILILLFILITIGAVITVSKIQVIREIVDGFSTRNLQK